MSYKAFISYSHAEHAKKAGRIHHELSRFATPWYRRRRMRLFLDDANLPATPSLWKSIERALEESEYLIFLASPAAASSDWCEREIRYWLRHKSRDTIVLVVLSGAIRWDTRTNDFDWSVTTSIPKALQGVFADQPRYIDLGQIDGARGYGDAAARGKLADIAAVLLGTPKDDLIGEDLRLHQRALKLAWGAASILLMSSVLAAWQWYQATLQRDLAEERLAQAVDITERMLFDIDEKLAGVAGAGELRRSLTYSALSLLIELRQKAARQQDVRWAQMAGYYQKGNLALRYGDLEEAEAAFVESRKIAEDMVAERPGYVEPYHSLALSYHALGNVKAQKQSLSEAYDAFDHAKQLADFILEDKADDEDTQLLLLNLYRDWGDAAYENRDIPTAHRNYSAGLELISRLTEENPDDAEYWFIYAVMLDRKARYFPIHTDAQKLLGVREEAIDILQRLVDEFPETAKYRLNLAIAYEKLGDIAFTIENFKGAKDFYSHAIAAMQALYAAEPINNLYKSMLAVNYGHLGQTFLELGRPNKALDLYEQEHAWMQTLARIDPDNQNYALGYILAKRHLGDYYARARNRSRSVDHYQSAIQLTRSYLKQHDQVKGGHLLMAAVRTELSGVLAGTDAAKAAALVQETANDLEHWLENNPGEGEGWLYLGKAHATGYSVAVRAGDAASADRARRRTLAAVGRMSQSDRKKFAKDISNVLRNLDEVPARKRPPMSSHDHADSRLAHLCTGGTLIASISESATRSAPELETA